MTQKHRDAEQQAAERAEGWKWMSQTVTMWQNRCRSRGCHRWIGGLDHSAGFGFESRAHQSTEPGWSVQRCENLVVSYHGVVQVHAKGEGGCPCRSVS